LSLKWVIIAVGMGVLFFILVDSQIEKNKVALTNPAAVYCVNRGYSYEIEEGNEFCVFPDGSKCNGQEFYTKKCDIGKTEGRVSLCNTNEDCIPLPSCHPLDCINNGYATDYQKPDVCTEIFLSNAAYLPEDCICVNRACVNKNK